MHSCKGWKIGGRQAKEMWQSSYFTTLSSTFSTCCTSCLRSNSWRAMAAPFAAHARSSSGCASTSCSSCTMASAWPAGVYQPQACFSTKDFVQPGLVTKAGVPQARLS